MKRQRHKRKNSHVIIVTSDAVDAGVKQYRVRPWVIRLLTIVSCVLIGGVIGYFLFYQDVLQHQNSQVSEKQKQIEKLQAENASLQQEIDSLNDTVQILSETVNQKVQNETELTEQLEKQSMPTEFPLKGAASMEESGEDEPLCVFTASAGTLIVATASGVVTAVNDDAEYGHNVWIDHGNGYVTVYRNAAQVKVKQGERVTQGTTLFILENDSDKLGYQMLYEGKYMNPMDMLAISG